MHEMSLTLESATLWRRELHDATIHGVVCGSKSVDLAFTLGDKIGTLHFDDVRGFLCSGMRLGNIVSDIEVMSSNTDKSTATRLALGYEETSSISGKMAESLTSLSYITVVISPSYGADIFIVCRSGALRIE